MDDLLTSFSVSDLIETISLVAGQTKLLEFETVNTGDTDLRFTSAILRDENTPESYDWIVFEGDMKAVTFDINLLGGLSTDNKFIRYSVSIPEGTEPGTYFGVIEVNGDEQVEKIQVQINVEEGTFVSLFSFLNTELFEIPFTSEKLTGAVIGGVAEIKTQTFKVWMLLTTLVVLGVLGYGYSILRKRR